ncbi:MAG: hypothetical protein GY822_31050 [Deltaproteobacteria bacterium]|nr:hypothetical protein [Deltaproteobacteria bacterium]
MMIFAPKEKANPAVLSHPEVPADFKKRNEANFDEVKKDAKPARQTRHAGLLQLKT